MRDIESRHRARFNGYISGQNCALLLSVYTLNFKLNASFAVRNTVLNGSLGKL